MSEKSLDILFEEAFSRVSNMEQDSLPQDVMLRLYAYYKQATHGALSSMHYGSIEVRDAFKLNAWMQVSHLSEDESKECYIELVKEILSKDAK